MVGNWRNISFTICLVCLGFLLIQNQNSTLKLYSKIIDRRSRFSYFVRREVRRECKAQKHLMFLKTHKTASSTLQNIILRFVEKENLELGLPKTGGGNFYYHLGKTFNRTFLMKTKQPIDVICNHMIFEYNEVKSIMPNDTTFITILREPASQFESLFDYMHKECKTFSKIKKSPTAVETWISGAERNYRGKAEGDLWWMAKNNMVWDLGFKNLDESDVYIQSVVESLGKQFQFVLISDYFDESMILLKDLLCWNFVDILYLKNNARNTTLTTMSDALRQRIRKWNKLDSAVYDYFNTTFWKKVEDYGVERMKRDVARLNELNKKLKENCVEGDAVPNALIKNEENKLYSPEGIKMSGYNIKYESRNNKTCINVIKSEIARIDEFRSKIKDTEGEVQKA